jgi:hypothetical protein
MNHVISYRTEKEAELRDLASKNNTSVSQQTSDIVFKYFDFHTLEDKFDMIRDTKKTISMCFEFVNESNLKYLSDLDAREVTQSFKTMINDFSFENITHLMCLWFKFNSFDLQKFDEDIHVKFVCKNLMSKNWNIHQSNVFVKIFKNFGFDGCVETGEKHLLTFKILKKKQT